MKTDGTNEHLWLASFCTPAGLQIYVPFPNLPLLLLQDPLRNPERFQTGQPPLILAADILVRERPDFLKRDNLPLEAECDETRLACVVGEVEQGGAEDFGGGFNGTGLGFGRGFENVGRELEQELGDERQKGFDRRRYESTRADCKETMN
jgi:hypothetical protein